MLRLGKDVAVHCKICGKPIAPSRIRIRPTVKTCGRRECNQAGKQRVKRVS